jgi:hypothetical protein
MQTPSAPPPVLQLALIVQAAPIARIGFGATHAQSME